MAKNDVEETGAAFELYSKASGILATIWGVIESIIYLPRSIAAWLTNNLQAITPAFLDFPINGTAALIIGLGCTALWSKKWNWVVSKITGFLGHLPLIGGFAALVVGGLMWWSLFQGCRGIANGGWAPALIFLFASGAINIPGFYRKFWGGTVAAASIGKDAAKKGGKLAGKATSVVGSIQWKDPLAKEIRVTLEELRAECTRNGLIDDKEYLARAKHLQSLMIEKFADKATLIKKAFATYQAESGIRVVDMKANAHAFEHHLECTNNL